MQIRSLIGPVKIFRGSIDPATPASSPGQQELHYAPRAIAYRFEPTEFFKIEGWRGEGSRESVVVRGSAILTVGPHEHTHTMEMPTDPVDFAHELYADLRMVDEWTAIKVLFIEMPPDTPEWLAVRDRLLRATRPLPAVFPPD